jgi:HD-GYP domain-containing protein (c-di-GMP phosphodiesterase class II)
VRVRDGDRVTISSSPDLDLGRFIDILSPLGMRIGVPIPPELDAALPADPIVYVLSRTFWESLSAPQAAAWLCRLRLPRIGTVLACTDDEDLSLAHLEPSIAAQWVSLPLGGAALRGALRGALAAIRLKVLLEMADDQIEQRSHELRQVHQVGAALSAERDMTALQHLVVRIARQMTRADAATLYLVREDAAGRKILVFEIAQNDSVAMPARRPAILLTSESMAGFVASTGEVVRVADAYHLPDTAAYTFNPDIDRGFGYRSRSMLVVPMRNHTGEVIGVLQLINRKRHFSTRLLDDEAVEREVEPFSEENEQLLLSFASQAAVAIENKKLVDDIEQLLAGFVRASVTAIEARDPATSGHSARVARLTVGLARAVNDVGRHDMHFTAHQLKEIEYAGLLHDFGKVGVREHVLVKAKKLYDWQLELIRNRFQYAALLVENRYLQRQLACINMHGAVGLRDAEARLVEERDAALAALAHGLTIVTDANEPTVLEDDRFQALFGVAERVIVTPTGEEQPLLLEAELHSLRVRRGTLDDGEIEEIRSHVNHSFNFLMQIPWTRDLRAVPGIAAAHHEKLDGTGYPRQLSGEAIPVQARMMTIADIFDALVAQDRPYKPAVPIQRACAILQDEARRGAIDQDLLDLFVAREVYRAAD